MEEELRFIYARTYGDCADADRNNRKLRVTCVVLRLFSPCTLVRFAADQTPDSSRQRYWRIAVIRRDVARVQSAATDGADNLGEGNAAYALMQSLSADGK